MVRLKIETPLGTFCSRWFEDDEDVTSDGTTLEGFVGWVYSNFGDVKINLERQDSSKVFIPAGVVNRSVIILERGPSDDTKF